VPDPLSITVETVALTSEQEQRAWPAVPAISGGEAIQIRGVAQVGCGSLHAEATRRAAEVAVTILSRDADRPCVATTPAWQPFSVVINVEPGDYQVRASVVGYKDATRAAVAVR
jgi:hypothetical protein